MGWSAAAKDPRDDDRSDGEDVTRPWSIEGARGERGPRSWDRGPSAWRQPRSRGTTLLALRAYLEREHGADAYPRLLAALPERGPRPVEREALATEWLPSASVVELYELARELYGRADFFFDVGTFIAEYDLHHVHRFLLRFTSPGWMFDRGARMWAQYHDSGRWQLQRSDRLIRGTLVDFAIVHRGFCRSLEGWLARAAALTGATAAVVDHPRCRSDGATGCVFSVAW